MDDRVIDKPGLLKDVEAYAEARGGKIYSPIDHPDFSHIPYHHGPDRFDAIQANMPTGMKTALDIGTHWGYFAHRLEQLGLQVTAAESSDSYLSFLRRIRTLYGDKFEIYPHSVFTMEGRLAFDVVLGLNIFHHFTKTEDTMRVFEDFLSRLDCKAMFFQAHNPEEGQMKGAHRNFEPDAFCDYLIDKVPNLSTARMIATFGRRPMYLVQ